MHDAADQGADERSPPEQLLLQNLAQSSRPLSPRRYIVEFIRHILVCRNVTMLHKSIRRADLQGGTNDVARRSQLPS